MTRLFASVPIQPLFASHARSWLLVWTATLLATVTGSFLLAADSAGSWLLLTRRADFTALAVGSACLLLWGVAGSLTYRTLLRRPVLLSGFVAGTWGLFVCLSVLQSDFTFLAFAIILQSFIFLPSGWSFVSVLLFVGIGWFNVLGDGGMTMSIWLVEALLVAALGGMFLALWVSIRRANEESRLRGELIARLEAAQSSLAEREREAGILAERTRLSRDLHDTLAQSFAGILAQLAAAQIELPEHVWTSVRALAAAQDIARVGLQEIRQLVWALRPAELDGNELEGALRRLSASWSRQSGIVAECEVAGEVHVLRPEAEVALLRVTQEALSNAARHAAARHVQLRLTFEAEFVMLDVIDDGVGFHPEASSLGFGLLGMRERLALFGGYLLLEAAPNEGTTVTAILPLARVSPQEGAA